MPADTHQVGGNHYHQGGYIHWNLVLRTGMCYLSGNATKYISRWRKKGGRLDLEKALHYVEKLQESADGMMVHQFAALRPSQVWIDHEVKRFCEQNQLGNPERSAILILATWNSLTDFDVVRSIISGLILDLGAKPVPATDSNKHAGRVDRTDPEGGIPGRG